MSKFIRIVENTWVEDVTFLTPYQVIDECEDSYCIVDDIPEENWVEKKYCEEVSVTITEVLKSQRQQDIEELDKHLDKWFSEDLFDDNNILTLSQYLYNEGYRKTK